jgi:hypothetical protein
MSRPTHQWDISGERKMKIEDADTAIYDMPAVLDPLEAERYVESLIKFQVEDVGSDAWMEQHRRVEKLNLQAHQSAMTNSDEYVLEALLTFSKVEVLIHDLLLIELWKENVFPLLIDKLAGRNSIRTYFILYHEASVVNLLEVLLYHKHMCQAGGERMLELVDFVARKLARINSGFDFRQYEPCTDRSMSAKDIADNLANTTPKEELLKHLAEIEFKVCISACALARYRLNAISASLYSRL